MLFISDALDLNKHSKKEIIDLLTRVSPKLDKEVMTFRQALEQDSIQKILKR